MCNNHRRGFSSVAERPLCIVHRGMREVWVSITQFSIFRDCFFLLWTLVPSPHAYTYSAYNKCQPVRGLCHNVLLSRANHTSFSYFYENVQTLLLFVALPLTLQTQIWNWTRFFDLNMMAADYIKKLYAMASELPAQLYVHCS